MTLMVQLPPAGTTLGAQAVAVNCAQRLELILGVPRVMLTLWLLPTVTVCEFTLAPTSPLKESVLGVDVIKAVTAFPRTLTVCGESGEELVMLKVAL